MNFTTSSGLNVRGHRVESDVTGRQLYVPISHSAHQLICYDKSPHMYIYAPQALNLEGQLLLSINLHSNTSPTEKGIGRVLKHIWDCQALEYIDLILG
jgi:hypothetical protein